MVYPWLHAVNIFHDIFPSSAVQLLPGLALLCQDPAVLWDFPVTMPVEPHQQGACATVHRATSSTLPTTGPVKVSHLGHTCWVCATVHRATSSTLPTTGPVKVSHLGHTCWLCATVHMATNKMSVAPLKVSLTGHTHRGVGGVLLHTANSSTLLTTGPVKIRQSGHTHGGWGGYCTQGYQLNLAVNRTCESKSVRPHPWGGGGGGRVIVHRATNKMSSVAPVKVSLSGHTHRGCVLLCTGLPTKYQ